MSIPTTPLKFPLEGKPVDKDGNWTPTWHRAMQGLFTRTGSNVAPSNLQLATAIATAVIGAGASVDGDVAVYSGTTGLLIHDTGISAASLVAGPASVTAGDIAVFNGATGKLIKDSGVQLSTLATTAQIAQLVTGPATSVVGDIAVFNNTTGTLASDSGILASSLAPKASPALTGTPTAPTATAGTNTTQIATTAFVTTAVAAAGLTSASFSAQNNGTVQSIPNNAFTVLTLGTKDYDVGSHFASNAWTPPARLVSMSGSVGINAAAGGAMTVAIFKNGVEFKRGSQNPAASAGLNIFNVSCQDVPSGADVYDLRAFQASGAAQNTSGSTSITFFQGTTVQA